MKKLSTVWVLGSLTLFSLSASAFDFRVADAAFDARENNRGNIAKARNIYASALDSPNANAQERLHAMERRGRLDYYEGDLLLSEDDSDARLAIFGGCLEAVEKIPKGPQYYYWKLACTGLYAKSAGHLERIGIAFKLQSIIDDGIKYAASYEGAGVYRVAAGIYMNSAGRVFGLYDPDKALVYIDIALKKGPQYSNAILMKAGILKILERRSEGLQLLQDAKENLEDMISDHKLPAGLEPETKVIAGKIKDALRVY